MDPLEELGVFVEAELILNVLTLIWRVQLIGVESMTLPFDCTLPVSVIRVKVQSFEGESFSVDQI